MATIHIDENNWRDYAGDGRSMVRTLADGSVRTFGCLPRNPKHEYGKMEGVPPAAEVIEVISRSEWPQLVAAKQGSMLSDLCRPVVPCLDQNGLGYCHAYAAVNAAMAARVVANLPFNLLSPESIGGPITGWTNRGADPADDLKQLCTVGACAASFLPRLHSLAPSTWKPGWKEDCANYVCLKALDVASFDEVFTLLLRDVPVFVGLDWWGHAVCYYDPIVLDGGGFGVRARNSWGATWGDDGFFTLSESKATPDGAYAVYQMIPSEIQE